jgi:hypothetical protein
MPTDNHQNIIKGIAQAKTVASKQGSESLFGSSGFDINYAYKCANKPRYRLKINTLATILTLAAVAALALAFTQSSVNWGVLGVIVGAVALFMNAEALMARYASRYWHKIIKSQESAVEAAYPHQHKWTLNVEHTNKGIQAVITSTLKGSYKHPLTRISLQADDLVQVTEDLAFLTQKLDETKAEVARELYNRRCALVGDNHAKALAAFEAHSTASPSGKDLAQTLDKYVNELQADLQSQRREQSVVTN